ncbi:MAG: hypothetical protein HY432_03650 [Candidatus Liptonbacteria bacterium]|nr:hypothetical protein [Candidatus Liptonbacteria bacterium]
MSYTCGDQRRTRGNNWLDFFIEEKIAVDLKAKPFVTCQDYYQMQRYLELAGYKVGINH